MQVPVQTASTNSKSTKQIASQTKKLRDLKPGDEVKRVKQVFERHPVAVLDVVLADAKTGKVAERLTTTREHPFYVDGKGWMRAGSLSVGNAIVTRAGPSLKVASVVTRLTSADYRVYNFEVEDNHNYFVGKTGGGILVHNASYVDPYDIRFSQDSIDSVFQHGEWAGRSLDDAISQASTTGKLPSGLSIEVHQVGEDLVTLNNRTLYIAQQANLSRIPVKEVPNGWNRLWKLMRDVGGPLPYGVQPRVR